MHLLRHVGIKVMISFTNYGCDIYVTSSLINASLQSDVGIKEMFLKKFLLKYYEITCTCIEYSSWQWSQALPKEHG